MELGVKERIMLQSLLPKEANFLTLKIVRVLREELSFSEDEHKALKMKQQGQTTLWDDKEELLKEVEIPDTLKDSVVKSLKEMDESGKLTLDHLTLFEKLVI